MTNVTSKRGGTPPEETDTWTVASAKAHLSSVLDRARGHGPQVITRNGRPAAVVVAPEEWERKTRRTGSLSDFFATSPLRDVPELDAERLRDAPGAGAL